jgi:hypothetical protein
VTAIENLQKLAFYYEYSVYLQEFLILNYKLQCTHEHHEVISITDLNVLSDNLVNQKFQRLLILLYIHDCFSKFNKKETADVTKMESICIDLFKPSVDQHQTTPQDLCVLALSIINELHFSNRQPETSCSQSTTLIVVDYLIVRLYTLTKHKLSWTVFNNIFLLCDINHWR